MGREIRKSFLRFCEWKRSGIWIVLFHSSNSLLYKWLRGKSGSERGFQLSWRFWFFIIRQLYSSRPRMARILTDLFWMFYIFLNTDFSDLRGFLYLFWWYIIFCHDKYYLYSRIKVLYRWWINESKLSVFFLYIKHSSENLSVSICVIRVRYIHD